MSYKYILSVPNFSFKPERVLGDTAENDDDS